jgi:hypothetical protein
VGSPERFDPPAFVGDFGRRGEAQARAMADGWHAIVDFWIEQARSDARPLFFNSSRNPGGDTQPVPWDAFPQVLARWFEDEDRPDEKRWRAAEALRPLELRRIVEGELGEELPGYYHRQQDEYCEWHVDRDGDRIRRIAFTCEGPEYWTYLVNGTRAILPEDDPSYDAFDGDLALAVELYREHVDAEVAPEDLVWPFDVAARGRGGWYRFAGEGDYNAVNKWNTTRGCMHLTHPSNTLGAEIELAAAATVPRRQNGSDVVDTEDLVCCAGYGDPSRSSDPIIGAAVNGIARGGLSVSLANPVGLYMADVNLDAFSGPNGEDVGAAWRVRRGSADRRQILRATFEAPDGADFSVDQMRANGVTISWGGQIADAIQMELTGVAEDLGAGQVARVECETKCCRHPERGAIEEVVDLNGSCADVDWDAKTPLLETPAEVTPVRAPRPPGSPPADLRPERIGSRPPSRR